MPRFCSGVFGSLFLCRSQRNSVILRFNNNKIRLHTESMGKEVFITGLAKYLPNEPVPNDEMEEFLGLVKGMKSRSKNIVLRNNKIRNRYYAIDKKGKSTHSNAELTVEAIRGLFHDGFQKEDIDLLACGTTSADQLLPSHASMVQGVLQCRPIEVIAPGGSCNAGMLALKYGYMAVAGSFHKNAVCTGSEKISTWMLSENFEEEVAHLERLGENPYVAFEREFLRWMLSDGAAALLIEDKPKQGALSYKIEWIENKSYANELETCMYAGAEKTASGDLNPWRDMNRNERINKSVFLLQQDIRMLEDTITKYGGRFLSEVSKKYNFDPGKVDYFLPHMSSEFFRKKIHEDAEKQGFTIPEEKWFTNLTSVGNVGSASAFLMLEELYHSGELKQGDTILVMVPESARFSYTYAYLTVV